VLHGCQFANDKEVKDRVNMYLHAQLKKFFADGIRKLIHQSNKSVEKLGDIVEK
jgi:hypothetical protein